MMTPAIKQQLAQTLMGGGRPQIQGRPMQPMQQTRPPQAMPKPMGGMFGGQLRPMAQQSGQSAMQTLGGSGLMQGLGAGIFGGQRSQGQAIHGAIRGMGQQPMFPRR